MKAGRKNWDARPIFQVGPKGCSRHWIDRLASVGREVILQSGADTNDRMRIAEVVRYTSETCSGIPLQDMVIGLGADLLPDEANAAAREQVHLNLYGDSRCALGFVAMRLEPP